MPRKKKPVQTHLPVALPEDLFQLINQVTACPPEQLGMLQGAIRNRLGDLRMALKIATRRA